MLMIIIVSSLAVVAIFANIQRLRRGQIETIASGGHFLSLDQPERLARLIKSFG